MATDTQVPQNIVDQFSTLSQRVQNEGITDNTGKVLAAPTAPPLLPNTNPYSPNLGNVTSINEANKSMVDFYAQQAKDYATAKATAAQSQVAAPKTFDEFLASTGKSSPTQFQASQYSALGVDPAQYFADLKADTAAVDTLNKDLNESIAQRDQALADVQNRAGGTLDFMNAESTRINRNANVIIGQKTANINAKMALIEMKKGNFNEAQNFVKDAVNAYTATLEQDLNLFTQFRQENKDLIDNLDKKYQNAIENEYKVQADNLTTLRADKDKVGNLLLQYPDAGITMGDSLDQAIAKASKYAGRKTDIVGSADTGYSLVTYNQSGKVISKVPLTGGAGGVSSTGFKNSKVESDFRQDAVALKDQVTGGAMTNDSAYTKLRDLYSPTEVTDDAIRAILGIEKFVPPSAPIGSLPAGYVQPKTTSRAGEVASAAAAKTAKDLENHPITKFVGGVYNYLFKPYK